MQVPHSRSLRLRLWPGPARRPCNNRPRSLALPGGVCSMRVPHSRCLRLRLLLARGTPSRSPGPAPARRPWDNRPRSLALPGDACSREVPCGWRLGVSRPAWG